MHEPRAAACRNTQTLHRPSSSHTHRAAAALCAGSGRRCLLPHSSQRYCVAAIAACRARRSSRPARCMRRRGRGCCCGAAPARTKKHDAQCEAQAGCGWRGRMKGLPNTCLCSGVHAMMFREPNSRTHNCSWSPQPQPKSRTMAPHGQAAAPPLTAAHAVLSKSVVFFCRDMRALSATARARAAHAEENAPRPCCNSSPHRPKFIHVGRSL